LTSDDLNNIIVKHAFKACDLCVYLCMHGVKYFEWR